MNATGIIFSNLHDKSIPELTADRTMASIPFLCRYRLADFPLSNMSNAGITDISVITHNNYYSLMEHIGSGKDWDLARRKGGVKLLSPFIRSSGSTELYRSRLEALMSIDETIADMDSDCVVMADCNVVCNIDLKDMIRTHLDSGAKITMAIKHVHLTREEARNSQIVSSDDRGRITDLSICPPDFSGEADVSINVWIIDREYLQGIVANAESHGLHSFSRDVMLRSMNTEVYRVYRFDGYCAAIGSLSDYYRRSMEVLASPAIRAGLFGERERPIYTHVRNSAPTIHASGASVHNSLIADGCVIEGTVENSILFRGVHVARGAVVRNSILFQNATVDEYAELNCVIADKGCGFGTNVCLSGHETMPFYIAKGRHI